MDRGLNQWKTGGSLENKPGRTGISGYGPLDRDLAAQDGLGLDLIWRVDPRSGGPGRFGAWGRRRSPADDSAPRRRGWKLAGARHKWRYRAQLDRVLGPGERAPLS